MKIGICLTLAAVAGATSSQIPLHLATEGLLQIPPSFTGDGITLYPAHHPTHDASDLEHLMPKKSKELYFSQEGHRSARHGAKHGSLKAKYNADTIVLDHTSHLDSIKCDEHHIKVSFKTQQAFDYAEQHWTQSRFHLVTFHKGCGDEFNGKRSYFSVNNATFDPHSKSVSLDSEPIHQNDALDSGEIEWGTYKNPEHQSRTPVKGHIRLTKPEPAWRNQKQASKGAQARMLRKREFVSVNGTVVPGQNNSPNQMNTTDKPLPPPGEHDDYAFDDGDLVDLNKNRTALIDFFGTGDFDQTDFDQPLDSDDNLVFVDSNGTIPTEAEEDETSGIETRSRPDLKRSISLRDYKTIGRSEEKAVRRTKPLRYPHGYSLPVRDLQRIHRLEERGIVEFFQGLFNAVSEFFEAIGNFIGSALSTIAHITYAIAQVAIIVAKLIAVPFGVPFDEAYHHDFTFDFMVDPDLAKSGTLYTIQCVDCGIRGDFTVDGRLAFSISDGITEGAVSLVNHNPLDINAVFGITVEQESAKPIEAFSKQIASLPLSPLAIPGIITLGPQISVSGELDLSLNGKAEFVIGAQFSLSPGTAALDLVHEEKNMLEGLTPTFTPILNFTGTITATAELGLPVALEVGLDILSGKFKKSVALVDKPSTYATATTTTDETAACPNGAEIRVGIKNRIYASALGLWDHDLDETILFEKQLACVTAGGFSNTDESSDDGVIADVIMERGTDISTKNETIEDVASTLAEHQSKTGFRLIMDQDKSSILVSGKDGYVYLVDSSEQYDASSPWGTIRMDSPGVDIDVFGRILAYLPEMQYALSAEVRVWDPSEIPDTDRAAALTSLKDKRGGDTGTIGIYITRFDVSFMYYPTFCATKYGLRLYATYFPIDRGGFIIDADPKDAQDFARGLGTFPDIELDCATVQLVYV